MLYNEQVLTFSEAAKRLPKVNGKRPHSSSVWRWARRGVGGVKLETRRIGGRFVTSAEALERFTKRLAEVDVQPRPQPRSTVPTRRKRRTSGQRAQAVSAAEHELTAAGI